MLSARKTVKCKNPRVRKRSAASAPPEIDFEVVSFNPTLRLRRDPEIHRSFSLRADAAKGRQSAGDDANISEGDRESWDFPVNDEEHSDSNDDDFYITAVHSTFSNSAALEKYKSRAKRRSKSSSAGLEASGMRLKNNLARLGQYTKDVVKGVFPVSRKFSGNSDDAGEPEGKCSHLVNSVVSLFSKSKGEKETGHRMADTSAVNNTTSAMKKATSNLMHYLTETSHLGPRRSPRRRDKASSSRAASEYSTEHKADVTADRRQDVSAPLISANRDQRSLRTNVNQWQSPIDIAFPETCFEEERYFELPDTPRYQQKKPKTAEYSSLLGTSGTATRIFLTLTVLLLAAVVYHFQLIAVMIYLVEMFVGRDSLPLMTGIAGLSTVVATCLIAERIWKH